MKTIHLNCYIASTEGMVMNQVLRAFEPLVQERGFSFEDRVFRLARHLSDGGWRLLLVLDEVGYALPHLNRLLYVLLRFHEYLHGENPISLLLISPRSVYEMFDGSVRSVFKKNIVRFPPYSADELFDILRMRAELALSTGAVDDDTLRLMAETASADGDARLGIEILERSARAASADGSPRILPEHVRYASASVAPSVGSSDLSRMADHLLLALLGIARELRQRPETTSGEARRAYHVACEEYGLPRRSDTQHWKYIRVLEGSGMVSTRPSKGPHRGRTRFIRLRDAPSQVLESAITEILRGRGYAARGD